MIDPDAPIAVVLVSYNTRADLEVCLCAIEEQPCREVVVVDNCSTDGSPQMVRSAFPRVALIENDTNRGYGAAANQGVASCRADYVFLLNADTVPERMATQALAEYIEGHPEAALVGPRLVDPDGTAQPSCYPFLTPLNVLLVMTALYRLVGSVPPLARRFLPTMPLDRPRPVPWLKGAALAIRRSAFDQVGGFDEHFFMYGEEADLAYRLRAAGWQSHIAPVARVVHRDGASTPAGQAAIDVFVWGSLARFYRLHYPHAPRHAPVLAALVMAARIARDGLKLVVERQADRRLELRRSIGAWHRILRGRFEATPPHRIGEVTARLGLPT